MADNTRGPCPAPFVEDAGECVFTVPFRVFDEFGHELDGDNDPKGKHGCQHRDTPEWKAAHKKAAKARKPAQAQKEVVMAEQEQVHEEVAIAAPETSASVGADSLDFDLTKVIPKDGQVSGLTVLLGGLAIFGGIALKVVPPWLKSRTEMASKRLELKAKRMELESKAKKDEKDGDCTSRHAACLAKISALEDRMKLVEKQTDSLAGDIASSKDEATKLSLRGDGDEQLTERVVRLEKHFAALPKQEE